MSKAQDPIKPTKPKTFQELLLAMQKEQIERREQFRKKSTSFSRVSERNSREAFRNRSKRER